MEQGREASEAVSIPDGLIHRLGHVQPLHPLDLDMYPRQPHQVRRFPIGQGPAPLDVISMPPEDAGQLPLAVGALAL